MVRKIFYISAIFLVLISLSVVAATNTPITIKTFKNHDVQIKVLDPYADGKNLIEAFNEKSDEDGLVMVTCSHNKNPISIAVMVIIDGRFVKINDEVIHKFDDVNPSTPFYAEILPIPKTPIVSETPDENLTEELEENVTEEVEGEPEDEKSGEETTNESSSPITGFSISEKITSKNIIYIIGGIIVLAGILVFFLLRSGHKLETREPEEPRVMKLSEMQGKSQSDKIQEAEKKITEAERGLEDAKRDLEQMKD